MSLRENHRDVFLYSLSSVLIGGVGRHAEHIATHIASRVRGDRSPVNEVANGTPAVHPANR